MFPSSIARLSRLRLASLQRGVLIGAAAATISCSYLYASGLTITPTTTTKAEAASNNDDDRLNPWKKRWSAGKTRWHKTQVHPSLEQYFDEKLLADDFPGGGARILVPLCGKTVDMQYLATKRKVGQVVGVDGVRKAMEEFSTNHPDLNVQPSGSSSSSTQKGEEKDCGLFEKWTGESISLLVGDFFDIDKSATDGPFNCIWDRAAMVAIQPKLREQYVQKLGELLHKPGGRILLATMVRANGDTTTGPPFSIDESEVRRLFEGQPWVESVELLDSHSAVGQEPWYKAIFLYLRMGNVQEKIFLITTK